MRLWSAAAVVVLVACGGKLATEATDGPTKTKTIIHDGDDHEVSHPGKPGRVEATACADLPIACDSTGCTVDGTPRMECQNKGRNTQCRCDGATIGVSQTQILTPTDAVWAWETFCGGSCTPPASSSGDCDGLDIGCGSSGGAWKCSVTHPSGPNLDCYATENTPARCSCFGLGVDGGGTSFALPSSRAPEVDELQTLWQDRCGGICRL